MKIVSLNSHEAVTAQSVPQQPPPQPQATMPDPQDGRFRCPDIRVGDTIMVGKYKQIETTIAKFGIDENGQPTIISTDGIESKMFTFRLKKLMS